MNIQQRSASLLILGYSRILHAINRDFRIGTSPRVPLNSTLVERGIRELNKNLCRADY